MLAILFRIFGRSPLRTIRAIKTQLFDLGALYIRFERSEADNRAKDETIASQNRQIDLWKARAYSLGYPAGSTGDDSETCATPPTPPPPTPK